MRKNANDVNRAAVEADAKISFSANIQGANREREEAEARAKVEAEMKEKVEKTRKAREAKAKAEADTVERARVWAEKKVKYEAKISRIDAEDR